MIKETINSKKQYLSFDELETEKLYIIRPQRDADNCYENKLCILVKDSSRKVLFVPSNIEKKTHNSIFIPSSFFFEEAPKGSSILITGENE